MQETPCHAEASNFALDRVLMASAGVAGPPESSTLVSLTPNGSAAASAPFAVPSALLPLLLPRRRFLPEGDSPLVAALASSAAQFSGTGAPALAVSAATAAAS